MRDFRETQQEETLALARALQHCMVRLEVPFHSAVWCSPGPPRGAWHPSCTSKEMTSWKPHYFGLLTMNLGCPPPPQKRPYCWAMILHPRELQAITTHPSNCPEETPEPQSAAKLEWTAADPQGMQRQPLLPPPVFGPPLLESGEPQVRIPREAQLGPDLHGFHVDGNSQEWIHRWIWVPVQNMSSRISMPGASLIPWPCLKMTKKPPFCELSMKPLQTWSTMPRLARWEAKNPRTVIQASNQLITDLDLKKETNSNLQNSQRCQISVNILAFCEMLLTIHISWSLFCF